MIERKKEREPTGRKGSYPNCQSKGMAANVGEGLMKPAMMMVVMMMVMMMGWRFVILDLGVLSAPISLAWLVPDRIVS